MTITTNQTNNELTNKNNNMEMDDKMKFIYKLHNGLTLADELKEITGDDTFKFDVELDPSTYVFKNKDNKKVVLDSAGNINKSDIEVDISFEEISQKRLSRTETMLQAIWA